MKIVVLSPDQIDRYNWGWQLFRDEVMRQHEVVWTVKEAEIVLLGDPKFLEEYDFSKIDKPKICMVGDYVDYHLQNPRLYLDRNNAFFEKNKVDVAFFTTNYALNCFKKEQEAGNISKKIVGLVNGYSVDTNVYKAMDLERDIDVSMICNEFGEWCYPYRATIKKMICDEVKWKTLVGNKLTGPIHHEYVEALNRSKIFINSCSRFKTFSWKVHEALACGCLLLTDAADDMLGYRDLNHLVLYKNLEDLKEKINHYLYEDPLMARWIATQGRRYAVENHSNEVRAREMFQKLEGVL